MVSRHQHALRGPLLSVTMIGLLIWSSSCNGGKGADSPPLDSDRKTERNRLVDQYVIPSGVKDPDVITTMQRVPRHRFVPARYSIFAYIDEPLPIGHDQTISQPSLVASTTPGG